MNIDAIVREGLALAGFSLIHGTALAMLTVLLSATFFRRARPAFHAALWTVVLLKFLVPPVLPGEMALSSWLTRAGGSWWGTAATAGVDPLPGLWLAAATGESDTAPAAAGSWPAWPTLLLAGYLASVTWIAVRAWRRAACHRRFLASLPAADPQLAAEARQLARRMGIGRRIDFRIGLPDGSPYVAGGWFPTVVLPPSTLRLEASARRALIVHELAHVRRGDLWVRWLENAARVLFFFWPPVWWVCRRVERYSELACDQWALRVSRVAPDLYARSLLEILKTIAASPLPNRQLAFAGKSANLEERFKMIFEKKNTSPGLSWLMVPGLALWTVFAVAGGAGSQEAGQPETGKKKAHVLAVRSGGEEKLPAEVLAKFPEADLDGDGVLTVGELKRHLGAEESTEGVNRFEFRTRFHGEDGGDFGLEGDDALRSLMERFPEADSNGDGKLDPAELSSHFQEHGGPLLGVFAPRRGGIDVNFDVIAGSYAEVLAAHPEADADGDGNLSKSELQQWGREQAAERGRFAVRIDREKDGHREIEAFVWSGEEGDFNWISTHGDSGNWTSDDGHKIVVKIHSSADGEDADAHAVIVHRIDDLAIDLAEGEELSRGRADRLLRKHPEADLDGDGALSKEEVAALAAKLAEEKKQRRPQ